ncbi:hypothetical protein NLM33_16350 [Bradyrhizobium sp. CCGUVB1N3]|uniref:hypothetical protein n=1 Tax=Bradyrhizobium sp. CCGUVB1N3 TaxID=2949629 RepID=UPI0020B1A5F5|nr:hypothetical protein [Bradyrhizobium sp. CCGUVB1N3]MCP3471888.1 hypothetical protein [Bradyrhizobium sp. CCGUVB1N3]
MSKNTAGRDSARTQTATGAISGLYAVGRFQQGLLEHFLRAPDNDALSAPRPLGAPFCA